MPSTTDVRTQFLEFFESKQHSVLPSSSLVPHNDPTLMFANAGMNQFKNIFTGAENPPSPPRATTSQKCVRAGGKHNDLDNVGYTARHHTFFEMLGNFSFGDYFKEGAISHAWELITKVWGIDKSKLCVTVYHTDDEAFDLWKKIAGLPEEKIIRIDTNDNFWAMGDTGPCGPCSEIFYDHGSHIPGGPPGTADADGDRFIEIWNLVFMQYEQKDKDTRIALPKPSIDTGMGLERVTALLQGVHDNYDIDLFKTLIAASQELSKNNQASFSASHRVIADHLRSSSFLIADGVLPSNEGRGYVLRRIMRRAMRHAHMLGCTAPLMHQLVPTLVAEMGTAYPELQRAQAVISETLKLEEEKFKETLGRGLKLLEEEKTKISGGTFSGDAAFKLYDTYGFPLDLTQDILRADNIAVDLKAFEAAMNEQRERARAAWKGSGQSATSALWFDIKERVGSTEFLGYTQDVAQGIITALVKDGVEVQQLKAGEKGQMIVNQTPFYAESGGQVGDKGAIASSQGKAEVTDTQKPLDGVFAHEVAIQEGSLSIGDTVNLEIYVGIRDRIRANHSATHLLHAALRHQLGEHVTQKGSLVSEDRLRFDITNPKAISRDELASVEAEVNHYVAQNSAATTKLMTQDEAIKSGAMALFGEKYGDEVRVLAMGKKADGKDFSVELCGGTHVSKTGDIGLFKIVSEGSVSSGVRRIEAVTGEGVRNHLQTELQVQRQQISKLEGEQEKLLQELGRSTRASKNSVCDLYEIADDKVLEIYKNKSNEYQTIIETIQDANKKLQKELAEAKKQAAMGGAGGDVTPESVGAFKLAAKNFGELDAKSLRDLAQALQQKHGDAVIAALSSTEGKANIIIAIGKEISGKADAPALVKAAVAAVGGQGGGGRPDFAQGGGPDGDKLEEALAAVKTALAA